MKSLQERLELDGCGKTHGEIHLFGACFFNLKHMFGGVCSTLSLGSLARSCHPRAAAMMAKLLMSRGRSQKAYISFFFQQYFCLLGQDSIYEPDVRAAEIRFD